MVKTMATENSMKTTEATITVEEARREWELFTHPTRRYRSHVPDNERRATILSLRSQGLSYKQIGDSLDPPMSWQGVKTALKRIRKSQRENRGLKQ